MTAAPYPEPVPTSSTRLSGAGSASIVMQATIQGCDIVWPSPIGSAPSRYASPRTSSGRKRSRGTSIIARRTHSSSMPRRRSWRSTIRARRSAKPSVDVVPERFGLMDDHPSPPGGYQTCAFELGQEARGRLARGARELRDLRLGGLDHHVRLAVPVAARLHLREQRARHAAGHGLERLARQPLVGL